LFIILNKKILEPIYVTQTTTYLRLADENVYVGCAIAHQTCSGVEFQEQLYL